jgi:hypothetical protein
MGGSTSLQIPRLTLGIQENRPYAKPKNIDTYGPAHNQLPNMPLLIYIKYPSNILSSIDVSELLNRF